MDKATEIAAQVWCKPETSGIEMDARLAEAFANELRPLLNELAAYRIALEEKDLMLQRIMVSIATVGDSGPTYEDIGIALAIQPSEELGNPKLAGG